MGIIGDLSDFERGTVVGAKWSGLSISETAYLLGFSCTVNSTVYREWAHKMENIQWASILWAKMPYWCQRRIVRHLVPAEHCLNTIAWVLLLNLSISL